MSAVHLHYKAGLVVGSCQTEAHKSIAARYCELVMRRCQGANPDAIRQAFRYGQLHSAIKRQRRELQQSRIEE